MNAADRLYGITMQEKGVSTLVCLLSLVENQRNAVRRTRWDMARERKKAFLKGLYSGLTKTRDNIVKGFDSLFSGYSQY